jgi:hypothetical protein
LSFFDNVQNKKEDLQMFDEQVAIGGLLQQTNHQRLKKKKGFKL